MYQIVKEIMEKNNIQGKKLADVCLAICIVDQLKGSNRRELSMEKFVVRADEDWKSVLELLELVNLCDREPLPKVQRYRVICDALCICIGRNIEGVSLSNERSSIVARSFAEVMGVSELSGIRCTNGYSSIEECERVLKLLNQNSYDLTDLFELESQVSTLEAGELAAKAWDSFRVPTDKAKYIKGGGTDYSIGLLKDMLIYSIEKDILDLIRKGMAKNKVKTNYVISQVMRNYSNVVFGTYSTENLAPRLEVGNGFPDFMRTKLCRLFSGGMTYDFSDLESLVGVRKFIESGLKKGVSSNAV